MAKQHKYLLDIIEEGIIRPGSEREAEGVALHVRYKNVGIADGLIPAKIDKFFEDLSKTLSRQLYGALQNAVKGDDTLAELLRTRTPTTTMTSRRASRRSSRSSSRRTRTPRTCEALRADLEKAISPDALKDLTSASLAKFKTGIEQANKLLKDSQWHLPDAVIEEYILDAIGAKGATRSTNCVTPTKTRTSRSSSTSCCAPYWMRTHLPDVIVPVLNTVVLPRLRTSFQILARANGTPTEELDRAWEVQLSVAKGGSNIGGHAETRASSPPSSPSGHL